MKNSSSTSSSSSISKVNCAPDVFIDHLSFAQNVVDPNKKIIHYNPPVEQMYLPVAGPKLQGIPSSVGNTLTGNVEKHDMDDFQFHEQYNTFMSYGYSVDPDSRDRIVGDLDAFKDRQGATVFNRPSGSKQATNILGLKRKDPGDPSQIGNYYGPWAPYEFEEEERIQMAATKVAKEEEEKVNKEEDEKDNKDNKEDEKESEEDVTKGTEKSLFHGKQFRDYQGRTYIDPPSDIKIGMDHRCFIPKRCIHTWTGHTKGVQGIKFFPKSGHVLLSYSMDSTIKLWDVCNTRRCLRTFMGHDGPVRDVCFTNDGKHFISASYDKWYKYWDTETGECIQRFTCHKVPYCVRICPDNDRQHQFLVAQQNKRITQWDIRTGHKTLEYHEHLAAVNTVTFLDESRRFVSTSDDKKIFIWEYGLPVVIKHIAEPSMHAITSVAIHPNGKWLIGQSMDNQVVTYGAKIKFKLNPKKRFQGHNSAGYAAQVGFSPDGNFIISGDGNGYVFFWEWKNCRLLKKMKCHDQVTIGCEWHPVDPSRVATCSWDGTIKFWD